MKKKKKMSDMMKRNEGTWQKKIEPGECHKKKSIKFCAG